MTKGLLPFSRWKMKIQRVCFSFSPTESRRGFTAFHHGTPDLEYLSDLDRLLAQAILRRAYQATEVKTAQRLLLDLARRLETEYPSAAEIVREGLEETLTVLTLKLSPRLCRSLATTNAAESLISRTRLVNRNVKRWRGGQMMLRWVAAGILEAVKGFRRLKGYAAMPTLVNALRTRDRQLGLLTAQEDCQVA